MSFIDELNAFNNTSPHKTIIMKRIEPLADLVKEFKDAYPFDVEFNRHDLEKFYPDHSHYVMSRLLFILQKMNIIEKTSWSTYKRKSEEISECVKVR
jgi:hypothetical protein